MGTQSDVEVPIHDTSGAVGPVHATLTRHADWYRLVDHGLGDGTFQGGTRLRRADLTVGDDFVIGRSRFRLLTGDRLEETPLGPYDLVAYKVSAVDRDGGARLSELSLTHPTSRLLAVVGPSGAGKSSLYAALLGELPVGRDGGAMYVGDLDLRVERPLVRSLLGVVPQEDSLHPTLTVRRLLTLSDRVRRPGRRPGRTGEVVRWCEQLGLGAKLDLPVATLSGGQRKRVSVALELLAEPRILLLDEPTSGLDPGLDHLVMQVLRRLTRERDCVVVIVTHAMDNLDLADQVLVVASKGRAVYLGPPAGLPAGLGADSWAAAMTRLADEDVVAAVAQRYREVQEPEANQQAQRLSRVDRVPPARARGDLRPLLAHFPVLVHRQLWLLATRAPVRHVGRTEHPFLRRVRGLAVIGMPLLVAVAGGFLAGIVTPVGGLSAVDASAGPPPGRTALSLLVTLCMLGGQALTYGDLVSEHAVIRREHRTGTLTAAVVLAKWSVYAVVAAVQAAVVVGMFLLVEDGPELGLLLPPGWALVAGLAALAVAAMSLGLLISAVCSRLEQAVALATGAAIAQVALSGGLVDLTGPAAVLSCLLPSRLGFAAAASSVDLATVSPPGTAAGRLWRHDLTTWLWDLAGLGMLSVLCVAASVYWLDRRLSRGQS